jgi:hypothetical protein
VSQLWTRAGERSLVADAHRDDGKRLVVRADELLTAFVELESAIRAISSITSKRIIALTSGRLQPRRGALAESGLDRLRSDLSTVQWGILPLLGLRRGFDRCYGSLDCLIYGLTNPGLLKRGSSEACDEPKMEVNKPIRMRVGVRNWWPPWW